MCTMNKAFGNFVGPPQFNLEKVYPEELPFVIAQWTTYRHRE